MFGFWFGNFLQVEGDEGKMMVAREIEIEGEVIFQHSFGLIRTAVTPKQEHILTMADKIKIKNKKKNKKHCALFFTVPRCDGNKQNE